MYSIISSVFQTRLNSYGVPLTDTRNAERALLMAKILCILDAIMFVFFSDYSEYRRLHEEKGAEATLTDLLQEVGPHLIVNEEHALTALSILFHQFFPQHYADVISALADCVGYPSKVHLGAGEGTGDGHTASSVDPNRIRIPMDGRNLDDFCSALAARTSCGMDPLCIRKNMLSMLDMKLDCPVRQSNEVDFTVSPSSTNTMPREVMQCHGDRMTGTYSIATGFFEKMFDGKIFREDGDDKDIEVDTALIPVVDVLRDCISHCKHKFTRPCKIVLPNTHFIADPAVPSSIHYGLMDVHVHTPNESELNPMSSFYMDRVHAEIMSVAWNEGMQKTTLKTTKPFEYEAARAHYLAMGMPFDHQCPALWRRELNARAFELLKESNHNRYKLQPMTYPWTYAQKDCEIREVDYTGLRIFTHLEAEKMHSMAPFKACEPENIDILGNHSLFPRSAVAATAQGQCNDVRDQRQDIGRYALSELWESDEEEDANLHLKLRRGAKRARYEDHRSHEDVPMHDSYDLQDLMPSGSQT